jgi:O-acetyl-ADP-ribose deacetylase (regulator of RNase III)
MRVEIRDLNPAFVAAAQQTFAGWDAVTVSAGSILELTCDAVVSPANSFGFMDGGVDYAYSQFFGWQLQDEVQARIAARPFGELLVGDAFVVPTGNQQIPHLIVAPTMRVPKRITDPADVMLAARAAVRAAQDAGLQHIAFPGMGTGCGEVPAPVAAQAMNAGIAAALSHNLNRPRTWQEAQRRHFQLVG